MDILRSSLLPHLPLGVTIPQNRTTSFSLSPIAQITAPLTKFFSQGLPEEFSINIMYRQTQSQQQSLLCIHDSKTSNILSISVGTNVHVTFQNGYDQSNDVIFAVNTTNARWHSVSIGVRRSYMVLYFDCYLKFNGIFQQKSNPYFSKETLVHIGKCVSDGVSHTQFQVSPIHMQELVSAHGFS